jgi:hypothetical protein
MQMGTTLLSPSTKSDGIVINFMQLQQDPKTKIILQTLSRAVILKTFLLRAVMKTIYESHTTNGKVIAIKIADFSQTIKSLRVFGPLRGLQDHIFIHRSETRSALNIFGAEFA